jgi:predicted transcriptional regulator
MAEPDKQPVTMQELLVSSLAQTDALAKLLIEGLITRQEFMEKISEERATYQRMLHKVNKVALESRL